jgi:uncharacterized membrane protein
MRDFIRVTVLGGILFLLPLVVAVAVITKALSIVHSLATPMLENLPIETVAGAALIHVVSIVVLVLLCFLAGLAAQRPAAGRLVNYLEQDVLMKFPPYALLRTRTESILKPEDRDKLTPAVVRFDDYWQLAYHIETLNDGRAVVFLPGSPDPWSGSVCTVDGDRVGALDATVKSMGDALKRLGKGSAELLHSGNTSTAE